MNHFGSIAVKIPNFKSKSKKSSRRAPTSTWHVTSTKNVILHIYRRSSSQWQEGGAKIVGVGGWDTFAAFGVGWAGYSSQMKGLASRCPDDNIRAISVKARPDEKRPGLKLLE